MEVHEMRQERAKLVKVARRLLEDVETERRKMTDQEEGRWASLISQIDDLGIKIYEREPDGSSPVLVRSAGLPRLEEELTKSLGVIAGKQDSEPPVVRTVSVDESRVLQPEERMADWVRQQGLVNRDYEGLTFGSYLRAMVLGPRNDVERRALAEGTDSAGGYTVPVDLVAQIIDLMRAKARVFEAGVRTVPLTTQKTNMARLAADATATWHVENAAETASDLTFEQVQFQARTLMALVRASRELLEDSVNINDVLPISFRNALSNELDRAALFGSGTGAEPLGITGVANVNEVDMGTNGAQIVNYDPILDAIQLMEEDNAEAPTAAIMAPRTDTTIAKFKEATTNAPLARPPKIERLPFLVTTQVPITETHGTANNASRIVLGNWRELMIGMRAQLRIEVLRERYADSLQYGFLAFLRADIQPAHAQSFAQVTGIIL